MDKATQKLILNALREASIKWPGRAEALKRARKQVVIGTLKNGKPKLKYFWLCAKCQEWFRDQKQVEVDHIIEVGTFSGCLNDYAKRLFCEQSNLQVLCIGCHAKKTSGFNATLRFARKSR